MSAATLSARVAKLEKSVASLVAKSPRRPTPGAWKSVVGMFAGDDMMKRIDEHGAAIRRAESRKMRRG